MATLAPAGNQKLRNPFQNTFALNQVGASWGPVLILISLPWITASMMGVIQAQEAKKETQMYKDEANLRLGQIILLTLGMITLILGVVITIMSRKMEGPSAGSL